MSGGELRPVTRAEAEALVALYNRVTVACPGVPRDARGQPVGRRVSARTVEEATSFLRFCAQHAIDPERYIRARHTAIGWKARIPLKSLSSASDNWLDHFKLWGDAAQVEAARVVQPVEDLDGITPYTEALKARYTNHPDLCMVLRDTRGWNPASEWCSRCSAADRCRRRLPAGSRARREAHAGE